MCLRVKDDSFMKWKLTLSMKRGMSTMETSFISKALHRTTLAALYLMCEPHPRTLPQTLVINSVFLSWKKKEEKKKRINKKGACILRTGAGNVMHANLKAP